jgi:uncharacterized repeat protein (TIGR01451 family)
MRWRTSLLTAVAVGFFALQAVAQTVTPHDTVATRLPSHGTTYTVAFVLSDTSSGTDPVGYDLLVSHLPGGVLTTVSITGAGVTQDANPDSARVTLVPGSAVVVTLTYSVGDVAAGSIDTIVLTARAVADPATSDSGKLVMTVIRPSVTVVKSVTSVGPSVPGANLTYTITLTNTGTEDAVNVVHVDSVPAQLGFKVGSAGTTLPGGVTGTVSYSNNGGTTWSYVPVSAGCGAPAGYDYCVRDIRLSLANPLSNVGPNNIVQLVFIAQVK